MSVESERFATPRVAAGVLFKDAGGRVLLVKPTYKDGWEIPGGYVEIGESPRAAAAREVKEELGLDVRLSDLLVLDWAPHPAEGDKLLVIFDGGQLDAEQASTLVVANDELSAAEFFDADRLSELMPARLARRVIHAARGSADTYLEHGTAPERDGDQSRHMLETDE